MKSCFIMYDIAIAILEQMKPGKDQVILFLPGFSSALFFFRSDNVFAAAFLDRKMIPAV